MFLSEERTLRLVWVAIPLNKYRKKRCVYRKWAIDEVQNLRLNERGTCIHMEMNKRIIYQYRFNNHLSIRFFASSVARLTWEPSFRCTHVKPGFIHAALVLDDFPPDVRMPQGNFFAHNILCRNMTLHVRGI